MESSRQKAPQYRVLAHAVDVCAVFADTAEADQSGLNIIPVLHADQRVDFYLVQVTDRHGFARGYI